MERIRTAQELYCEIVKSFYFGIYGKDDRFMTYQEARTVYGLSKDTIGRAYGMLQRDGFIRTDGSNGTIVTFDIDNPAHVAKVPLEWPRAVPEDIIPYEAAMRLHAHTLHTGLTHSSEQQLKASKELVESILQRAKGGRPYHEQVFAFWMHTISTLNNQLLSRITDHFITRYLYLLPQSYLSAECRRLIDESSHEYYEFLLYAIERRDFSEFTQRFERHYHNYFKYGGVVFSKLDNVAVFKEQALYGRLLKNLCIKIMSGELKKGDALPTTKRLCLECGFSTVTVNRAYGILSDIRLIDRRVRSGTSLIADPSDPEIWGTLEKFSGINQQDWREAVEVLIIMNGALCGQILAAPQIVRQMWAELLRQHNLFKSYSTPYFAFAVLLNPVIDSLPAGILHKYYALLMDILNKIITLCTFRIHENYGYGDEIYQVLCHALEAIERGDQALFSALSERAMRRNYNLLVEAYARATKGVANVGSA